MGVLRCGHDRFFYWMHETRKGGASWLCVFGIWLQRPTGVTSPDSADTTFKGGEQHLSPEQHKEHKCHLVSVVKPKTQVHWCSLGGPRHTKREGAAWLRCSACFFSFSIMTEDYCASVPMQPCAVGLLNKLRYDITLSVL